MANSTTDNQFQEIISVETTENGFSIKDIKSIYAKQNLNMVSAMERLEDIIYGECVNDRDINFLKKRQDFYRPLLLKIEDLKEHGEYLIINILNATLTDTYRTAIHFFNNENCFKWNDRFQKYKTEIIKIDGDTNFLLTYIKNLFDSLFQLHCDFSNHIIKDADNLPDEQHKIKFDFLSIYNKVSTERDLFAKNKILEKSIAERDLLCLSLGLDPEKFKPNILFKEKCKTAIEIIKSQIENTKEKESATQSENKTTDLDEQNSTSKQENPKNPEFTTRRQVLALYYLLDAIDKSINSIDRTVKARFIHFLTGKNESNIYKTLSEPHKGLDNHKNNRSAIKDLEFIKSHFDELGLKSISQKITNDMQNP